MLSPLDLARVSRFPNAGIVPVARSEQGWRQIAAAIALLMIGGFSAWSSARYSPDNFAEGIAANTTDADGATYSSDSAATEFDGAAEPALFFDSLATDSLSLGNSGLAG
jgi:hypothetical protein